MEQNHPILEAIEPGAQARVVSRREAIRSGAGASSVLVAGLAMTSVPFALAALARDGYAQAAAPSIVDVLNFALTLEYLEDEFYRTGLAGAVAATLSPAELTAIQQISKHETAHVQFLTAVIPSLGGTPAAKPTFDFTAGGAFSDVFSNRVTFLAVAQTFEDTGVRAYKGQAGNVASNDAVLTAALQIHSVEARHASQVRRLRGQKGWITANDRGDLPPQAQATYDGEENTVQGAVDVASLGAAAAATEAFDEPLTMEQVLAIAGPFISQSIVRSAH
ncbi:MAG: ferritin-like domain-containing protein [Gemmatimonadales bacterium]|nr:ferritin-like domain-containing protein [Gemmatimonadales bacterium]